MQSPRPARSSAPDLALSVIVPTRERTSALAGLLRGLAVQTLARERWELVIVDDGSPEPVELPADLPFQVKLLRQPHSGPGAARNLALAHARAKLVLILNDDALPAPDLLERHVELHRGRDPRLAVLGSFHFGQRALASPFTALLERSDLLFDYVRIQAGQQHGWAFFWTCNLSLSRQAILDVGGFDAAGFPEPVMEDVELGYRLAQRGMSVLYAPEAVCEHDHVLNPEGYMRRSIRLGFYRARFALKHQQFELLGLPKGTPPGASYQRSSLQTVCRLHRVAAQALERFAQLERNGQVLAPAAAEQARELLRRAQSIWSQRGVHLALTGRDPGLALERGPEHGVLTSAIVLSYQSLDATRRCLERLRAARSETHPLEIVFVDNGSTDGSAEYLAAQPDVRLVRNARNVGAPRARNQALALANGRYVAFLDNDAFVPRGWLERLLLHFELDPGLGLVGPLSDRAAHGQQLALPAGTGIEVLDQIDADFADKKRFHSRPATLLSSFCVLARREVLDAIGGFDERFSPWGFEDDDFSLRAHFAGFRAAVAQDVVVRHEAYGGPKASWHAQLLVRNWKRFADKWKLPAGAAHGDYSGLEAWRVGQVPRELLFAPSDGSQPFDPADLEPLAPNKAVA